MQTWNTSFVRIVGGRENVDAALFLVQHHGDVRHRVCDDGPGPAEPGVGLGISGHPHRVESVIESIRSLEVRVTRIVAPPFRYFLRAGTA